MTEKGIPLRAIYQRVEERNRADLPLLSVYREFGVVPREGRDDNNNVASEDLSTYKVVRPGDLVLNKMKTWQGSLGVSSFEGIVSPAYFVGRRIADVDDRYMHHLLRSAPMIAEYGSRSKGIRPNQWDLPWDEFAAIKIDLPPRPSQTAIADYLDIETTCIDALISKKQRMSELAKERFNSVGRWLITGGDGGSRWQPGTDWLRPVPLSWQPRKIAWSMKTGSGTTPVSGDTRYYSEEGTPWVTTAELREELITSTAQCVTDQALSEFSALRTYSPGTVLVAMYGATVGRLGILGIAACTNQACCAIESRDSRVSLQFVYWWLHLNRQEIVDSAYGAGQPNISQEVIRSLRIPAPDILEQDEIVSQIEDAHRRLKELVARLDRHVELLQERRQALITAAVTGQLDIPEVAA